MTDTPAERDPQPRNGSGRWLRSIHQADRDRQAAEMAAQGLTYTEIADELGFGDKAAAWKAVRRSRLEAAELRGNSNDIRNDLLAELDEQRRDLWRIIRNPPAQVSRTGKTVLDPRGNPVPDEALVKDCHAVLARIGQRIAALKGIDAPRRSLSITAHAGPEEIAAFMEAQSPEDRAAALLIMRQHHDRDEREALERHRQRAIPGTVEDDSDAT